MRSEIFSTVPTASSRSTTSPMPYWSSSSMNRPAMQSLTRLCAPKPSATPAIPNPAIRGPSWMPSSPNPTTRAIDQMTIEVVLPTTALIELRRASRRGSGASSIPSGLATSSPARLPSLEMCRDAIVRSGATTRATTRAKYRCATADAIHTIRKIAARLTSASTSGPTTRLPSVTSNSRSQIQLGFDPHVFSRSAWASSTFTTSKVPTSAMPDRGCPCRAVKVVRRRTDTLCGRP